MDNNKITPKGINFITVKQAQALCLKQNIPFFSYQLPGSPENHFGAQISEKTATFNTFTDSSGKKGFIVTPFDTVNPLPALFIRADISFTNRTENKNDQSRLLTTHYPQKNISRQNTDCSKTEYNQQIQTFMAAFEKGNLKKAVLSRTITVTGNAYEKAPRLFEEIARHNPEAFVFLISVPGVATWMGATPETFLRQSETAISTMSLAGTQPTTPNPEKISWNHKDCEEQQIVSDYIAKLFSNLHIKPITTGPDTLRTGGVCHLCTRFESPGILPPKTADRLRKELHPTPAVGGFPKKEALQLIRKTEKYNRRYYAGYLGPIEENGTFDLFVNLRCMELFPDAFRIYVGGGITALSEPEKEWNETTLKSQTMLNFVSP